MHNQETFLTVGEVARRLGRSVESVRIYERRGFLPAIRTTGGVRLFREADVREFASRRGNDPEGGAGSK